MTFLGIENPFEGIYFLFTDGVCRSAVDLSSSRLHYTLCIPKAEIKRQIEPICLETSTCNLEMLPRFPPFAHTKKKNKVDR